MTPVIISRAEHNLSRKSISQNALKVLYRLKSAGAQAYLVGGSVRDILLGEHPKDFDIATNLHPEEVKSLFSNCLLIGRRFRLAHIRFGREIIEVATFRSNSGEEETQSEHGMILRDNVYGTLEEDIWRRDFTINALYYNIENFTLVDFCKGLDDIKNRLVRLIGDPHIRYREDPLRLLRAVRFAAKLHFKVEANSEMPLFELGYLLTHLPPARLFDEFLKLFLKGHALASFALLQNYGLFAYLFFQTAECLQKNDFETMMPLLEAMLHNTDERLKVGKKVTPAFLIAVFLWYPYQKELREIAQDHHTHKLEIQIVAIRQVFSKQNQQMTIPKRFSLTVQEIWLLQGRLEAMQKKQIYRLIDHPRFRAAYDFLLLRAQVGENVQPQADFWTKIQSLNLEERENFLAVHFAKHNTAKPRRQKTGTQKKKDRASSSNKNTS